MKNSYYCTFGPTSIYYYCYYYLCYITKQDNSISVAVFEYSHTKKQSYKLMYKCIIEICVHSEALWMSSGV